MCTVSMIGDFYGEKWNPWRQSILPTPTTYVQLPPEVTKAEFDQLRKEVLDMKELLRRAKIYDEKNGEPNCEIEDKMKFLREVAKLVGIDLDDVLKPAEAVSG